jgi:hypothetical protein
MDAIILHMLQRRPELAATNPLEQYVCVIDAAGAGWANVSMEFFRMLVSETNTHYPDRLQEVIVLGVNATVRTIWRVGAGSGIVHPRSQKKVKMVAPDKVKSVMRGLVPEEALPADYGGCAPALEHPALLGEGLSAQHVGALASAIWQRWPTNQNPTAPSSTTDDCAEVCSFSSGSSSSSCDAPARRRPSVQPARAVHGSCLGGVLERLLGTCNPCAKLLSPRTLCNGHRQGRGSLEVLGTEDL